MSKGRRKGSTNGLAPREQQALEILYKHGSSTAVELQAHIGDDLNNATVRTILRTLESKGFVTHERQSNKFIYHPVEEKQKFVKNLFNKMVDTFFSGSPTDAVATFIDQESQNLESSDYDELIAMIEKAKQKQEKQQ